ncbi:PAS domain S-box protein [Bacillus sp. FJAT-45037]|uniref:PAS domain S-box protein n=1 Tax=Bacillus sp. FJAT-45037 TaxID=2011007 RepID=UPI000C246D7A|nr:PAS domain S-box protein [Bacillus sp. FJAT-45037]
MSTILQGEWNLRTLKQMVLHLSSPTVLSCWRRESDTLEFVCINEQITDFLQRHAINIHDLNLMLSQFAPTYFEELSEWNGHFQLPHGEAEVEANLIFEQSGERYFTLYVKDKAERSVPEMHMNDLFNQDKDAIFVLDRHGFFVDMNKKAEELAGIDAFAYKGIHYEQLLLVGDKLNVKEHFEKACSGEIQVYDIQLKLGTHTVPLYIMNIPHIVDGEVIAIYGVAKKKNSACDLEDLSIIIQDKYQMIVENSYDIICLTDKMGHYLLASSSYHPVLGYHPSELMGKHILHYIHPNDRTRVTQTIKIMEETHRPSEAVVYRKLHAEGHYHLLEGKGVPILSTKGEAKSFVFISRDITDSKERKDSLRRSEKLALAGELAAGIAHEIRNPLTTLKGFFQLTEQQLEPYRDVLMQEINQINDIIEELLLVARPRAIQKERINVSRLAIECLREVDTEATLKDIQINLTSHDPTYIKGVPHQLKQVFINLFKNAIEAMEMHGTLTLKITNTKDFLQFIVKDNGIGMAQEELAKLGEPYYSTKIKGTGIGLMVCYKVIENHKGHLSIESKIGWGTEVTIHLPSCE